VWVNEQDVDRAMQIISEMKEGGPATIEPQSNWTCPKCGEVLEGQFSNCWNCSTERPNMT
jgi:rubrerythrin